MNRAVFLDRDGTIIEDRHYLHKPDEVVLCPGAAAALRRLQEAGFKLILVTNQSGVGRGYFTMADVKSVHAHLVTLMAAEGVRFDRIYIAPEAPDQPSRYRKPSPQALLDARDEFHLDLGQCHVVGDKLIDLECGWNAGVKQAILVRTGYGAKVERENPGALTRAIVVDGLSEAVDRILA